MRIRDIAAEDMPVFSQLPDPKRRLGEAVANAMGKYTAYSIDVGRVRADVNLGSLQLDLLQYVEQQRDEALDGFIKALNDYIDLRVAKVRNDPAE